MLIEVTIVTVLVLEVPGIVALVTVPSIVGDTLGVVSKTVTMAPVPLCPIV